VLADCLIRTAPAKAEDALQDNMLREKLAAAAGLLDAFVAANPKADQSPDALLKLGYCHKRLGTQLAPGTSGTRRSRRPGRRSRSSATSSSSRR
jgi:hypothetical protein